VNGRGLRAAGAGRQCAPAALVGRFCAALQLHGLAKLVLTVVIFAAVWSAYSRYRHHTIHPSSSTSSPQRTSSDSDSIATETHESPFHCDGRTYCSQMTSCSEAKYFLAHCPDVKMDGDHDGIPCERQWCPNG